MKELLIENTIKLLPERKADSNKSTYGTMLSITGSTMYRSAALLSGEAALRSGVGILKIATINDVISSIVKDIPEATYLPVDAKNGHIDFFDYDTLENPDKISSCLIGCGLTNNEEIKNTVESFINKAVFPLILDADALNSISDDTNILKNSNYPTIITPHPGEFSRLTKKSIEEIKNNPEEITSDFSKTHNCITVLKMHYTVISDTDGTTYISNYGNSGLARGGSGDVLAGLIASFKAQGLSSIDSTKLGVTLHGYSADRCAKKLSQTYMLPRDIIAELSNIFSER